MVNQEKVIMALPGNCFCFKTCFTVTQIDHSCFFEISCDFVLSFNSDYRFIGLNCIAVSSIICFCEIENYLSDLQTLGEPLCFRTNSGH